MVWPDNGNPGFLCVVVEKSQSPEKTLEKPIETLDVTVEFATNTITELCQKIKDEKHLDAVYVSGDSKYQSYIREYMRWRRDENCKVILRCPQVSSFEAGVLKIKEYTAKGLLTFGTDSIIKAQLRVFSKLSLKNEGEFYAVSALTQVINSFKKRTVVSQEHELSIKSWY
jgi:hypothetical protein